MRFCKVLLNYTLHKQGGANLGQSITCDVLLVAVGRKTFTQNLKLERVAISTDQAGRIEVDQ